MFYVKYGIALSDQYAYVVAVLLVRAVLISIRKCIYYQLFVQGVHRVVDAILAANLEKIW